MAHELKRKLSAILSADVKGYSRLMGEDEEWTVRTLDTFKGVMKNIIPQHRGRVVDSTGDNLLAEFASPPSCCFQDRREGRPPKMAYALPDRPSIAVLPFMNMSDDKEQEYFADGFAKENHQRVFKGRPDLRDRPQLFRKLRPRLQGYSQCAGRDHYEQFIRPAGSHRSKERGSRGRVRAEANRLEFHLGRANQKVQHKRQAIPRPDGRRPAHSWV